MPKVLSAIIRRKLEYFGHVMRNEENYRLFLNSRKKNPKEKDVVVEKSFNKTSICSIMISFPICLLTSGTDSHMKKKKKKVKNIHSLEDYQ